MRDYHGCSICGRKFPEDALTLFAGDYFCEHCLDEETVVCSDCGERLWNDATPVRGRIRSASDAMTAITQTVNAAGI